MTTRQKLSAFSLGALVAGILAAFALTFSGCATGPDVKPYRGGGVELVSEQVGWAGPPMPAAPSFGFRPPLGAIDPLGTPVQIRVGVRNGRDYPMKFTLTCGEVGRAHYDVVTIVEAEQERGLYFSMSKRVGPQAFECHIKDLSSVLE
jgi:hypothetical protein